MKFKRSLLLATLSLLIVSTMLTTGCFDIHSAREIIIPPKVDNTDMTRGTIADVRYEFQGAIDYQSFEIGAQEFVRKIDNFEIGKLGGELYVQAQVHFFMGDAAGIDFERYVVITILKEEKGTLSVMEERRFDAISGETIDISERIFTISDADPGMWSLRAEGYGTRTSLEGTTFYDWFHISVNGIYSDDSHNYSIGV
ncbi:MAG: hypothetical protein KAH57_10480 [Thermoplasmata archaeon]|nr:hypothetical protein [Thermoplasmata archaeon]